MRFGYVVSDLHLFADWSRGEEYLALMETAAGEADFFVFNGDIFDFRWTTLPSIEKTVNAALEWLRGFVPEHPACKFFYILGNHDCYRPFVEKLVLLVAEIDNLKWHASHFRIGNVLFLHGDLPISRKDPFIRKAFPVVDKKGETLRRSYGRLIKMGAHKGLRLLFHKKRSARLIFDILASENGGPAEGVTDIYFGHTHVAFTEFTYEGITFHNTGSAIGGLPFNMLPVKIIEYQGLKQ